MIADTSVKVVTSLIPVVRKPSRNASMVIVCERWWSAWRTAPPATIRSRTRSIGALERIRVSGT